MALNSRHDGSVIPRVDGDKPAPNWALGRELELTRTSKEGDTHA